MPESTITLTGPYDGLDASLDSCTTELRELSPQIQDACSDHTDSILSEILGDDSVAPGSTIADDGDVSALRNFITKQHTEYWFADLNGRGSDLEIGWDAFKSAVRLYSESVYLRAFEAYKTANEHFSEIERTRREAEDFFEDIETRLQRDNPAPATEEEPPLQSLVSDAHELVADGSQLLESAKTDVVKAHAYYAIGECYRDEYEIDADSLGYVSLADDADWHLEDLRHRRDRADTRIRWIKTDFSKLNTSAQHQ
jgi:hypothetical protein